ncbi:MAG: radical SAM protein [Clostridia bacterium]|nr:radical SAM protein [Clostridia bacterium]
MENNKTKVPVDTYIGEIRSEAAKKWDESRPDEYKEYRRKWVENPKNFILEEGPLNLDLEVTSYCNLKCPMCPRTVMIRDNLKVNGKKFESGYMDLDLFKNLIDQAVEMGVKAIKLNWLGEPLAHKNIVEMVAYAKQKGIIDILMNTNAVFLTEKLSRELIEAGLDKLSFSFDSPQKEDYEKIRIGANFDKVIENIKTFNKIRTELGKDTPQTRVSMVLMKSNQHQYQDFVNLFKDVVDVVAYSNYSDHEEIIGADEKTEKREKIKNFSCAQLWQRMFVTWDGDVIVCCVDIMRNYIVGNAKHEKLKDIWKNQKYEYMRKKHKKGEYMDIPICSKCDAAEFDE